MAGQTGGRSRLVYAGAHTVLVSLNDLSMYIFLTDSRMIIDLRICRNQ